MIESGIPSNDSSQTPYTCNHCGKGVTAGLLFAFKVQMPNAASEEADLVSESNKCFSCAVRHRPMLKRSLIAALVVGTTLTVLNQGDTILTGQWNNALYWKIPLTYCVPFLVATYGALTNSRK